MKALINPQFPYAQAVPVPQAPPTDTMPLLNYYTEGKIAGIQQGANFNPFAAGPHRGYAMQGYSNIGAGIQQGQLFNQPLVNTFEG